jgi:hypothetical protein
MHISVRAGVAWVTLAAMLVSSSPAWAQPQRQHIADSAVLEQAIADRHAIDAANRELLTRVLDRSDVRAVAERMGLDVKDARSALGNLTSDELAAVASHARAVEADLAGGAQTVTISITTLLLIIIIILLIAD